MARPELPMLSTVCRKCQGKIDVRGSHEPGKSVLTCRECGYVWNE